MFTQEYLRTGVGVVTCQLASGPHRLGLPPTLEIPYYHGPVYDELGPGCTPLVTFRDLYLRQYVRELEAGGGVGIPISIRISRQTSPRSIWPPRPPSGSASSTSSPS